MMPCRITDILQVVVLAAGPDTTLAGNSPHILPLLLAHEDPLELYHSGIGE